MELSTQYGENALWKMLNVIGIEEKTFPRIICTKFIKLNKDENHNGIFSILKTEQIDLQKT